MKEMNALEIQLRSWEPRHPSAALKQRIFGSRTRTRRPGFAVAFGWLAPAAACAFLAVSIVNQEHGISTGASRRDPMVAMIGSNQMLVAGFSNGPAKAGSNFSTSGFEWTNRSDSTSSIGSFLPAR
jgi:hypothetical protein